jgi:positive phototaxis protein PixI
MLSIPAVETSAIETLPNAFSDDAPAANFSGDAPAANFSGDAPAANKLLSLHLPLQLLVAIATQQLTEILPITPLDITPVPESPDSVMGVYNWRGEVLWLVDLGFLMGQTPLFHQRHHQLGYSVIVIQFQCHALGLVVNDIGEIQTMPSTAITPPLVDATIATIAAMFQGCYQTDDGLTRWILDVDAIIDRIAQWVHSH